MSRMVKIQAGNPPLCVPSRVRAGRVRGTVVWKVTGVPDGVSDGEVVLRFSKVLLWIMEETGAYEFEYSQLEDESGVVLPSYAQMMEALKSREGLRNKSETARYVGRCLGVGERTVWNWLTQPESRMVGYSLAVILTNSRLMRVGE